jgi:hypothetical protein
MEAAPLKSFATWARTSLIREVTARIAIVLAPASPERVEQRGAVEALEKAVTAAGGGDKGKAAVADRVAYSRPVSPRSWPRPNAVTSRSRWSAARPARP